MSQYLSEEEKESLLEGMDYNKAMSVDVEVLEELKAYLESKEDFDKGKYSAISNALTEKQSQQEQEKEAEERHMKQVEMMDGLLQAVRETELFEAIKPQPDEGERLHEYEERRKEFYLILHDFVREQQQKLIDNHNEEIEQKDEKIRLLNKQCLEVQQKLDEMVDKLNQVENDAYEYQREMLKYQAESKEKDSTIADLREYIDAKDQQIETLENEKIELSRKLEQQKTVEYQKPSESITERVNNLKAKSNLNKTVEERMHSFFERNKDVIKSPLLAPKEVEPSGASFPSQAETGTVDELADAAGTQPDTTDQVTEHQFPRGDLNMGTEAQVVRIPAGSEGSVEGYEDVSEAALQKRIRAIEERLDALERHTNIRMSA